MGCGKAEALIRIAESHNIKGVGVDLSPDFIRDARSEAERRVQPPSTLELFEMRGEHFESDEPFDVVLCLGASWIYGGLKGTLESLQRFVKPHGLLVVGEPYWIKSPEPEYIRQLEASRMELDGECTHAENVAIGVASGLAPLFSLVSTQADWDNYEWHRVRAAELYALQNPEDPDVPALLKRARLTRDLYLKFGRDSIGWAIYLFVRA